MSSESRQLPVPHTLTADGINRSIEIGGWKVETRKGPISSSKAIDDAERMLGIPVPEMIFGDNCVRVTSKVSGASFSFETLPALDSVSKTGTSLRVAHADHWSNARQDATYNGEDIKQVTRDFDWTYTAEYAGTTSGGRAGKWVETEELLPVAELKKQDDPILFYDEVILYESELDDNGISVYNVRVRVMGQRMLVLARYFLRLDNVVLRIRDTRLYVGFDDNKVLRETLYREATFADVKSKIPPHRHDDAATLLADPNWISERCPIVDGKMEVWQESTQPAATARTI
ncbi:Tap42 interacting protein [Savitreella phatthalungensis]